MRPTSKDAGPGRAIFWAFGQTQSAHIGGAAHVLAQIAHDDIAGMKALLRRQSLSGSTEVTRTPSHVAKPVIPGAFSGFNGQVPYPACSS